MSGEAKQPEPTPNPNNEGDSKGGLPIVVKTIPSQKRGKKDGRSKNKGNIGNLAKGIRFGEGQPANKGGRPKGLASMVRELTKDGRELVNLNLQIMRGKLTVTRFDSEGNAHDVGPSIQDRQRAIEYLTDRGFGKAIDLHADVTGQISLTELAVEIVKARKKVDGVGQGT